MPPKLIVIEGTNASGKSSLGVELAARFSGEIVSADSRQVFRRLDLGSGKITPEEMKGVPHHLLDVRSPGEFFSMADFQRLAYEAIDGILSRGRLPFLVGGTGLYADAVADGYELSDKAPDHSLRALRTVFQQHKAAGAQEHQQSIDEYVCLFEKRKLHWSILIYYYTSSVLATASIMAHSMRFLNSSQPCS